jgi:hypothetical protein
VAAARQPTACSTWQARRIDAERASAPKPYTSSDDDPRTQQQRCNRILFTDVGNLDDRRARQAKLEDDFDQLQSCAGAERARRPRREPWGRCSARCSARPRVRRRRGDHGAQSRAPLNRRLA